MQKLGTLRLSHLLADQSPQPNSERASGTPALEHAQKPSSLGGIQAVTLRMPILQLSPRSGLGQASGTPKFRLAALRTHPAPRLDESAIFLRVELQEVEQTQSTTQSAPNTAGKGRGYLVIRPYQL